jgi:hypothetical protein
MSWEFSTRQWRAAKLRTEQTCHPITTTTAQERLGECFRERNSEGMLKNMAIHELCLAVTFAQRSIPFPRSDCRSRTILDCQTIMQDRLGKEFTDFDKLKFTIETKDGAK